MLVGAWGTAGEHAGPCFLAKLLAADGYVVHVMGNSPYADMYKDIAGVTFHPLNRADPDAIAKSRFGRTSHLLKAVIDPHVPHQFAEACRLIDAHDIRLVLTSWITPALFTVAHLKRVPVRPLYLYPLAQPGAPPSIFSNWRRLIRSGRCTTDEVRARLRNIYRRNLPQSEQLRQFHGAPDDGALVPGSERPGLVLFPSQISRNPDWLHLHSGYTQPPCECTGPLRRFLDSGPKPWLLTFGTFLRLHGERVNRLLSGLLEANQRVIIIGATKPRGLLANNRVLELGFTPLGTILPKVAGVVHHAGINTACETIAAGRVSLFCPISGDQFDNAYLLERLGAGTVLADFSSEDTLADALTRLSEPSCEQAVANLQADFVREGTTRLPVDIAQWIEAVCAGSAP